MSVTLRCERSRRRPLLLLACIFAALCLLASPAPAEAADRGFVWEIEQIAQGVALGGATAMALDSMGRPHIAFADIDQGILRYVRWDGSGWLENPAPASGFAYGGVSLALDARDRPHISFFDAEASWVKYAHLAEFGWRVLAVDRALYEGHHSLGLDANGVPHIAYSWINGYLRHARLEGSAWVTETADENVVTSRYTSVAVDASGDPHIGYYAKGNLYHARWDGSHWEIEAVENESTPQYVTLKIGSDGVARIAYRNERTTEVRVAEQSGPRWDFVTVDRDGEPGWDLRMALDGSNRPHLSYYDRSAAVLKYAREVGTEWRVSAVDLARTSGWWSDVAVGADGLPRFVYYVYEDHSVRYATGVDGFGVRTWPARDLTPTTAFVQAELTGLGSLPQAILAIEWRAVDGEWQRLEEASLVVPGLVSVTLDWLTPETSYEVRAVAVVNATTTYGATEGFRTPVQRPAGFAVPLELLIPAAAVAGLGTVMAWYFVRQRRRGAA